MALLSCPPTKPPKMLFFRAPADAEDAPMEAKVLFFRGGPPSGSSSWGPPQRAMNEARRWPLGRLLPIAHDRTLQRNTPTARAGQPAGCVLALSGMCKSTCLCMIYVGELGRAWGRIAIWLGLVISPSKSNERPHGARSGIGVMCRGTGLRHLSGCHLSPILITAVVKLL